VAVGGGLVAAYGRAGHMAVYNESDMSVLVVPFKGAEIAQSKSQAELVGGKRSSRQVDSGVQVLNPRRAQFLGQVATTQS